MRSILLAFVLLAACGDDSEPEPETVAADSTLKTCEYKLSLTGGSTGDAHVTGIKYIYGGETYDGGSGVPWSKTVTLRHGELVALIAGCAVDYPYSGANCSLTAQITKGGLVVEESAETGTSATVDARETANCS